MADQVATYGVGLPGFERIVEMAPPPNLTSANNSTATMTMMTRSVSRVLDDMTRPYQPASSPRRRVAMKRRPGAPGRSRSDEYLRLCPERVSAHLREG